MEIQDTLKDYKMYLIVEKGLSKNTVENYLRDLDDFFVHVRKSHNKDIDADDINEYLCFLDDHYATTSIQRKIISLRQYFLFLLKEKVIDHNIMEQFDLPKQRRTLPQTVSLNEASKLLSCIDRNKMVGQRDYCMITLLLNSGMRVSEMVNLTVKQINLHARNILVRGKGDKERLIPIDNTTCDIIKDYMYEARRSFNKEGMNLLFLTQRGKPVTRENFYQILNKYAKKAGVKAHFTPHKLRHTYATTMLEGHADLRSIQELLGHSDISTTTIYTHVNNKKIQNDYERFFPDRKKEGE